MPSEAALELTLELILASRSPRRLELLREARFAPTVIAPDVCERELASEAPERLVQRLALAKAESVAARLERAACVLGADTVVVLEARVLGKPRDADHAVEMLLELAGRSHRVLTGYALLASSRGLPSDLRLQRGLAESQVVMRAVTRDEARTYAATGEPLDKAGAYALQGLGGRFVAAIDGSRSNVIGLPLERVVPLLERLGVRRACPSS